MLRSQRARSCFRMRSTEPQPAAMGKRETLLTALIFAWGVVLDLVYVAQDLGRRARGWARG